MSELAFDVVDVAPDRYAAAPTLLFRLRVAETTGATIHVLALRAQIRIEPQKRRYSAAEEEHLLALFGETPQWGDSLRPFNWTYASAVVPGFTGSTDLDLPVTCTYDMDVAAAKYLHSLVDGEIPVVLLFSGTAFEAGPEGALRVNPVPWHKECPYRLPVRVWREMMDLFFPDSAWIRIPRHTLDDLERYKTTRALPTWEQTLEALFKEAGAAE